MRTPTKCNYHIKDSCILLWSLCVSSYIFWQAEQEFVYSDGFKLVFPSNIKVYFQIFSSMTAMRATYAKRAAVCE